MFTLIGRHPFFRAYLASDTQTYRTIVERLCRHTEENSLITFFYHCSMLKTTWPCTCVRVHVLALVEDNRNYQICIRPNDFIPRTVWTPIYQNDFRRTERGLSAPKPRKRTCANSEDARTFAVDCGQLLSRWLRKWICAPSKPLEQDRPVHVNDRAHRLEQTPHATLPLPDQDSWTYII